MRLSFNLEYNGDCNNALNFYVSVFNNAFVKVKTFKEMDMADALGINGQRLDMVWQSRLHINYSDSILCMEMSDSLMAAMQKDLGFKGLYYNPVICILHENENYIRGLFKKIYGNQDSFESLQNGKVSDPYGIRWKYQKSKSSGIFYCLSFDGFCSDVIAFYESIFDIKATEVIKYSNSPYSDNIPSSGADKIYSAIIYFDNNCALKLSDSIESAMDGVNRYNSDVLLFYQGHYNPVFTLRDNNPIYLSEAFKKLMNGGKLNRMMMLDSNGSGYGSLIDKYGICWNLYSAVEEDAF